MDPELAKYLPKNVDENAADAAAAFGFSAGAGGASAGADADHKTELLMQQQDRANLLQRTRGESNASAIHKEARLQASFYRDENERDMYAAAAAIKKIKKKDEKSFEKLTPQQKTVLKAKAVREAKEEFDKRVREKKKKLTKGENSLEKQIVDALRRKGGSRRRRRSTHCRSKKRRVRKTQRKKRVRSSRRAKSSRRSRKSRR